MNPLNLMLWAISKVDELVDEFCLTWVAARYGIHPGDDGLASPQNP
jgi:hypothetical protein